MTTSNPAVPPTDVSVESRQLLLLVICSLGLVVAAFAAPAATAGSSPPDLPIPDLIDDGETETADCAIGLDETPVPGRQVTVSVSRDAQPVTDVTVWFNDQRIGRTNQSGQVQGRVPYVRDLEVTVGMPSGGECQFDAGPVERPDTARAGASAMNERLESAFPPSGVVGNDTMEPTTDAAQTASNVTGTYVVFGTIDIQVEGRTDPGTNVTVDASIDGEPVPGATVTVDGTEVGTTDGDGQIPVRVPDDGSERMSVRVERGEIQSQRLVPVRLLQVDIHNDGLLAFPGQNMTAIATIGGEPAGNADVRVAGEQVTTTNEFGMASFDLPANPVASITVTAAGQTASANLVVAYAPTVVGALTAFILFVLVPLGVFWAGGRRAIGALALLVAVVLAVVGGYAVAGPTGAVVATLGVLAIALVLAVIRRPEGASTVSTSVGSHLDRFGVWLTEQTLWVATAIGSLVDQIRARFHSIWNRLRDADRSIIGGVWSWVVGIPGRLWALIWFVAGLPRRLLARLRRDPEPTTDDREDDERESADVGGSVPTIRQLWRRFASRVVPERWPQRTPGEVSREAVESGYPRDSVAELTGVFRDVEYGNQPLSNERHERAHEAFRILEQTSNEQAGDQAADVNQRGDRDGSRNGDQEVTGS